MRFFSVLTAVSLSLTGLVFAAPTTLKSVERYQGEVSGKYIVKFKPGVSRKNWITNLRADLTAADLDIINGIAVNVDQDTLNTLRASDDVESVSEDGIMHAFASHALNYRYEYDDSAGEGVDIYIVDTGVLVSHSQFGGRARWGTSFVGTSTDGHGHGTHCAGTAAGSQFGVAKKANIIAVQVLNSSGSGATSGIVSGLNWVLTQARGSGRPSVVSMSLGGAAASALDSAVSALTAAGVHVVVAAGNANVNAQNTSPARAPSAITVAASTIADAKASFSNFGTVIDVWGPGANVISSWIGSNTATRSISGTSMATPHVAGVVAYLIGKDGNVSPSAMEAKIKNLSTKNVLTGVPSGTVNQLVHI
ncbi:hypothetical protein EST38_g11343 [Candolleomyces aberdarensis]|uniref:Peptidase S8/S53 domain-containing protein n=1 Tax=Candolleomyces aberdarensis TaxID=2316362 RepID=A0A4Q2D535_9AGAR|nr:hypothetical protein EST38_g11343 [Candolleomyces aberdarensis]